MCTSHRDKHKNGYKTKLYIVRDYIVHETYTAADVALGLLEDDRAACLMESAALDTPRQLRYLFVAILVFCEPSNLLALYEANEATWAQQLDDMNAEQRTVFDRVMEAVDDGREVAESFYVDGPGGTGKTTLYGCLIWSLLDRGQSVLCVAFTGIAASLVDGGMTVHSTFGTLTDDSTSTITMQSERAHKIRDAALIVWDEAPMSPGLQLTVVDRLLRDVMGSVLPFGGKPVLFAGDFRRILPVVRRGSRADIVMSSIKQNVLWRGAERFNLVRNMRADGDAHFAAWLLQLGNGQPSAVGGVPDTVQIPRTMICDVADLIDSVCPERMTVGQRRRLF